MKNLFLSVFAVFFLISCVSAGGGKTGGDTPRTQPENLVAKGSTVEKLADGFQFTEGPASDSRGNLYFTDLPASKIHRLSANGTLSTFIESSGNANGLFFDKKGNLLACQGGEGRIVSYDPKGKMTVLADKYNGKRFNQPNDLWVDPEGGVYFSDPIYGRGDNVQGGYHVYYLNPAHNKVIRVIDNMKTPNGLVGPKDGKTLYVTDWGSKKTYKYAINSDGTLSNQEFFAPVACDGMTIDSEGNVYLTASSVEIYDPAGKKIKEIKVPSANERPTNVAFGGKDGKTLYITTAPTGRGTISVYSIRMNVQGVYY